MKNLRKEGIKLLLGYLLIIVVVRDLHKLLRIAHRKLLPHVVMPQGQVDQLRKLS